MSHMASDHVPAGSLEIPTIFVVDDEDRVREDLCDILELSGLRARGFPDCETFLEAYTPGPAACLLIDVCLPGISGIELLRVLSRSGKVLPAIMITGRANVPMAVQAMKAGALDFIRKPVRTKELLTVISIAVEKGRVRNQVMTSCATAAHLVAGLTLRQRQVMNLVLAGSPSKNIAADLGISQRTVENHRAMIMRRTGARSIPALAQIAVLARLG